MSITGATMNEVVYFTVKTYPTEETLESYRNFQRDTIYRETFEGAKNLFDDRIRSSLYKTVYLGVVVVDLDSVKPVNLLNRAGFAKVAYDLLTWVRQE